MVMQRACLTCGDLFAPRTSGGKPQVRCSPKCRDKAAAANHIKKYAPIRAAACAECGGPIAHADRGRPRRFCSVPCTQRASNRALRRRRLPIRNPSPDPRLCLHCSRAFTPRRRDQTYCCISCVYSASQARRRRGEPLRQGASFDRICVECNGAFVALKGNARWCSSGCRRRFTAREESRRRGPARPDAEPYADREIFERDGWICQLCKRPVDPDVSRRAGDGATIDHTIPLSIGGADKRGNVVTAHNRCNLAKANQVPVDVLVSWLVERHPGLVEAAVREDSVRPVI